MTPTPFSDPARVQALLAATPTLNNRYPFLVGSPVYLESGAGATVYGVNHPGAHDTEKFAVWKQTISGNKAFVLPSAVNAPAQTTGGAVADADQLRSVVLVDKVIKKHSRDDQVAASGCFVWGAGGGTAAGESTLEVKGTTAANIAAGATSLSVADNTGANTKTFLVGDMIEIAGDDTVYYVTETSQALNGTTEVLVDITPPLQQAAVAGTLITCTASTDRVLILNAAPAVGAEVEAWVLDSGDVATLTGGALTAERIYDEACYSAMVASALTNMTPSV